MIDTDVLADETFAAYCPWSRVRPRNDLLMAERGDALHVSAVTPRIFEDFSYDFSTGLIFFLSRRGCRLTRRNGMKRSFLIPTCTGRVFSPCDRLDRTAPHAHLRPSLRGPWRISTVLKSAKTGIARTYGRGRLCAANRGAQLGNKPEFIKDSTFPDCKLMPYAVKGETVRTCHDGAVLGGEIIFEGDSEGHPFRMKRRFADISRNRQDKCQGIFTQVTRIPGS
ncbi:MAG: hypothetical protein ABI357_07820 [Granulicella sp.]